MIKFNFKENKVQTMDLATLGRTYVEHDPLTGKTVRGISHHDLIGRIMQLASNAGLDCNVSTIFAAQNPDKNVPGVSIAVPIAEKYGDDAPEAHVLRRVYTTLHITDGQDEVSDTGLVIAYHQNGIQVAIGPNVFMCQNQCILHADRTVATYGPGKVADIEKLLMVVDDWFQNHTNNRQQDLQMINKMQNIHLTYRDVAELTGHLSFERVGIDLGMIKVPTYPLNNGQINQMVEEYLTQYGQMRDQVDEGVEITFSLWDIYNMATEMYKPDQMVIPAIIQQSLSWMTYLKKKFSLDV